MQGPHNPSIQPLAPTHRPPAEWSLKQPVRTRRAGPGLLCASSLQPPASSLIRSGFTLTELLIVIAIIGVLASLITVAAKAALDNAARARIILDAKNLSGSLENFKNDFGAYPPNAMTNSSNNAQVLQISNDMQRMMKKAFPRISPQELQVLQHLAGFNSGSGSAITSAQLTGGMTAAEALVFWLGGFSDDPQFPLSGPGGPSFDVNAGTGEVLESRKRRYEFDFTRFAPRNDSDGFDDSNNRFVGYKVDLNTDGDVSDVGETRQINLWQYLPGKSEQPMLYFDASRYKPAKYDPPAEPNGDLDYVYALKQYRQGKNADSPSLTMNDFTFVNQGKFQLIHCGLDEDWGDFGVSASNTTSPADLTLLYPAGPFVGASADTLTNFADGKLEDAAE